MSRPMTPTSALQGSAIVHPDSAARPDHLSSSRPISYANSVPQDTSEHETGLGAPHDTSILAREEAELHEPLPHEVTAEAAPQLQRSTSQASQAQSNAPSRAGTLKKKPSLHKTGSVRRSGSRRSSYAGSVHSMKLGEKEKYAETAESNSAFWCPVPTVGNPTEMLSVRFQAWRKVLKDLINYFRDVHKSYELRSKAMLSASNVLSNTTIPSNFLPHGGLGDAWHILNEYQKKAITEANKSRDLENEVIMQLTGLRSDLQQKIKEIKSLSGDFKNNIDREQEGTKRAVRALQESLGQVDQNAATASGKGDPFIVKMGVDKQIERQIEEENYLHRAFLNLEASGRELESIVVGEIQKAYNVMTGILRREADDSYETAEKLREGPLTMAKDFEWDQFVTNNQRMVDPKNPIRQASHIVYEGKDHPAAIEVRSGMLERKSKYLKNYTPGWYILSPTHLHEFKSADRIATQAPIMSLYLPEQKLGSRSEPNSSSHKFMLKGRQTGSMHRGHSWVFRAETYDTMMAWCGDIKELTEKTGEDRNAFVRRTHARSLSGNSLKAPSVGSSEGGMEEDEADRVAFSGEHSVRGQSIIDGTMATAGLGAVGAAGVADAEDGRSEAGWRPPRPSPGGRFPSDVNVTRGLQVPVSPSSVDSVDRDRDTLAAAGALPGSGIPFTNNTHRHTDLQPTANELPSHATNIDSEQPYASNVQHPNIFGGGIHDASHQHADWLAPVAIVGGGTVAGAAAIHEHHKHKQAAVQPEENSVSSTYPTNAASAIPAYEASSMPIPVDESEPTPVTNRSRGATESTEAPTLVSGVTATTASVTDPMSTSTARTSTDIHDDLGRPVLHSVRTGKSITTISDLHIPGEFPNQSGLSEEPKILPNTI